MQTTVVFELRRW